MNEFINNTYSKNVPEITTKNYRGLFFEFPMARVISKLHNKKVESKKLCNAFCVFNCGQNCPLAKCTLGEVVIAMNYWPWRCESEH